MIINLCSGSVTARPCLVVSLYIIQEVLVSIFNEKINAM